MTNAGKYNSVDIEQKKKKKITETSSNRLEHVGIDICFLIEWFQTIQYKVVSKRHGLLLNLPTRKRLTKGNLR